jgi:hypothetical protein
MVTRYGKHQDIADRVTDKPAVTEPWIVDFSRDPPWMILANWLLISSGNLNMIDIVLLKLPIKASDLLEGYDYS